MQPELSLSDPVQSVSSLVQHIKEVIEIDFTSIWVEGELSNFKRPASGHCYFTLKDSNAQIKGVMWSQVAARLFFLPADGMQVRIRGAINVYEKRGDLQLVVRAMEPAGEGALRQAFEILKQKLATEGLFDAAHKRPLPSYPESIGIITSGTGAALQDICSILGRRFPLIRALVCPVKVQGAGAAESIADAIHTFDALPLDDPYRPDLLIVGRGGGSIEDLWAFNEEIVARAIFDASLPIVSAVGHETDFSIADFVADVRAATPSMAAELAVPDRFEIASKVRRMQSFLRDNAVRATVNTRRNIQQMIGSFAFSRPVDLVHQFSQRVDELSDRLHRSSQYYIKEQRIHVSSLQKQLHLLNPRLPLERGYLLAEKNNEPVYNAREVERGDALKLHFHDGTRFVTVNP